MRSKRAYEFEEQLMLFEDQVCFVLIRRAGKFYEIFFHGDARVLQERCI